MLAAQYDVTVCATASAARSAMAQGRPDLLLVNLGDPTGELSTLSRHLRDTTGGETVAIIAVGVPDTARARFAALDAGADEVIVHPMDAAYLMARVRGLLLSRSALQTGAMLQSTQRRLGFEDRRGGFAVPPQLLVISDGDGRMFEPLETLQGQYRIATRSCGQIIGDGRPRIPNQARVALIDGRGWSSDQANRLLQSVHGAAPYHSAAAIVIWDRHKSHEWAELIAAGAGQVWPEDVSSEEVRLRLLRSSSFAQTPEVSSRLTA